MISRPRTLAAVLLAGSLALSATGCTKATPSAGATGNHSDVQIVASTTMLGDITKQITACAGGNVTTLIPQGTDPHSFQLSSQQTTEMAKAKLVIVNGLGLEQHFQDVLDNLSGDGAKVLTIADKVDPIPFAEVGHDHEGEHGEDHEDHEGHDHGATDPHFWLDASRGAKAATVIGTKLAEVTGDTKYNECATTVSEGLNATDKKITETLKSIPQDKRILITDHEAFGYFAKRYHFEIAGVVVPGGSTEAEPSSADIAALVKTIKAEGVRAIFTNTTVNPRLAEQVAKEVGGDVKLVPLYVESLSDADGVTTYNAMLEKDAELIADALKNA